MQEALQKSEARVMRFVGSAATGSVFHDYFILKTVADADLAEITILSHFQKAPFCKRESKMDWKYSPGPI